MVGKTIFCFWGERGGIISSFVELFSLFFSFFSEYFDPNEVCSAEDGACGISEEEEELEFEENENTVPDEPKENENTIPDEPKYTEEDIKGNKKTNSKY
jgi:hypothetical protein